MLICFFDQEGIVHREFVPPGMTVNADFYCDVIIRLRENVRRKRPQKWRNQNFIIHHDNVPAHSSFKVSQFSAKNNMTVIPQPTYSPDLAPCDYVVNISKVHFDVVFFSSSGIVVFSICVLGKTRIVMMMWKLQFQDTIYLQQEGLAMGAPTSSLLSEFYLQHMENTTMPELLKNTTSKCTLDMLTTSSWYT